MTVSNWSAVLAEQKQEERHRRLKTVKYGAEDKWWLVCCKEINSVGAEESQLKGGKNKCLVVSMFSDIANSVNLIYMKCSNLLYIN